MLAFRGRPERRAAVDAKRACAVCLAGALVVLAEWLPAHAAEKIVTPIGNITAEYKGKFVTVQGVIESERRFKSGMRYGISDDTGKITLVLFDRELKQAPGPDRLIEGARVNVTGKVDFFNKAAQIVPVRGTDVVIVQPAPPVASLAIGAISADNVGQMVAVQGVVIEASNFSAGFKLRLGDETGQIAVTLFENVFDALAKPEQINVGATLSVTGEVNTFGGNLEITPSSASRIRVVAAPPPRDVRHYLFCNISGNDHNAIVRVIGEVANIRPFDRGIEVLLKDETGAQYLRLYQVVAKRVNLNVGDEIEAIGRVRASRTRGIAIEVALPTDVQAKQ
ncbi:OB-fold nucleic acid binding domain-containing protein [Candidatus Roseilinea sp. NK_OTU-006]|uniref:OB-fold nucleic acid binding domain-containing protein n=1 Tax=Candidatus Roseilinea sp. NK_OTU-006 TaxID=2704250 RepID=UPI00145EE6A1|nr:OB-fold nucleic acid binding domain-containing protein [Candidatus Roseilinea sp. NK_OTU-006]